MRLRLLGAVTPIDNQLSAGDPAGRIAKQKSHGAGHVALRYSAATGDNTLGELAEWDPKFAEPFPPGALTSSSGLSERRDFPSK